MQEMMRSGEDLLNQWLEELAGEQVQYRRRDSEVWTAMTAVVGKSFFKFGDVNGVSAYTRTVDFLINVGDLTHEPEKGDAILRYGQVYEVYEPNSEPCWRFSGTNHTVYRIHSHAIGGADYSSGEES